MFNLFIRRPILSLVISLFITLLGLLALFTLPVTQFPEIAPPSVTVEAKYQGANADVCTKAVAIPLERAINGVPNMLYMQSVSNNAGKTKIEVTFKTGTDPDIAAVNVQNRVSTVLDELPQEVIRAGVTTEKDVNALLMYLNIMSTDPGVSEEFVYNFADINVVNELKRIDGVGYVEIVGAKDYAMRVWFKPDRLLAYNVSTEEVSNAIAANNLEAAPGRTGESSGKTPSMLQYVLRYTGKLSEPSEYENIIIRAENDGSLLRLKDVADVEFGARTYSRISKTDGRYSASIIIKQLPGSNARDVIEAIKMRMEELKETNFPPGMYYNVTYDVSRFLDASLHEVMKTLIEAFVLVFLVILLFLQDFRSSIIPALAVPVALIGTLFFMQLFGFTINLLTLFALVLAIGIVVDNAIVVVEAVHVKMHDEHLPPKEATMAAMSEISSAIITITLVMSAVFIPVAFMPGTTGIFYKQFSLTLAIAIVISGINAVSLTPALCALFLKPNHGPKASKNIFVRFSNWFNRKFDASERFYARTVRRTAAKRWLTLAMLLAVCAGTFLVGKILPTGFIPVEDQGVVYVNVTTPRGASLERTSKVLDQISGLIKKYESVESISTLAGYSMVTDVPGSSYGMAMISLKHWDERKESVKAVIQKLKEETGFIKDASMQFFAPPTVPGFGNSSGFELRLMDRTGSNDLQKLASISNSFIDTLNQSESITDANTSFDASFPQYLIHMDNELAAVKGVTVQDAMFALQTLTGSYYASNFIRFGQMYKVMLQAAPEYRIEPNDLRKLYVKNKQDEMVPLSTFLRLERMYGPEQITRYNMYNTATITGSTADGYSSGDVLERVKSLQATSLPKGYTYEWTGITREQISAGSQSIFIFAISLVFVYLLLAAQYESFLLPLPVIFSLPGGVLGAFLFLQILGLENNIYAQVALVMLIGLLGKNAILIVEFAHQRQQQGVTALRAAMEGAKSRLRPILMTSFAFIAGMIPLCIASGAGAMGNRSIGTAAAGGMLVGTLVGLLLVPGLYLLVSKKKKEQIIIRPKERQVAHENI